MFGDQIDYSKVQIHSGADGNLIAMAAFTHGNPAITLGNDIYVNDGYSADYSARTGLAQFGDTLSHEMTHIWQDQTGQMNYIKLGYQDATIPDGRYDVSKVTASTSFSSLGYEQQATVVQKFFDAQMSGNTADAIKYGLIIESGPLLPSGFQVGVPLSKMGNRP